MIWTLNLVNLTSKPNVHSLWMFQKFDHRELVLQIPPKILIVIITVSVSHYSVCINRVSYIKDDNILEGGPEPQIGFVPILRTVKFRTATHVINVKPKWQFTNYFTVGKAFLQGIRAPTVWIHDSVKRVTFDPR